MTELLSHSLVEDVRRGRVVLFLGAGASIGARSADGREPFSAEGLRDKLSEHFLGGKEAASSLAWVAELAISETDLGTVQDYIADLLRDLRPAAHHELVRTFRWRGLVTTNYDTVPEAIYRGADRLQDLVPIRSDADRLDELLRTPKDLPLLKLHGCITRSRDRLIPYILTTDQYLTHRKGRERLFQTLAEWGAANPVVFVGHSGQDSDIREILLELSSLGDSRPRYYLVRPNVADHEKRLWESKRVSVISISFSVFIAELNAKIAHNLRPVLAAITTDHPIHARYIVAESVSESMRAELTSDLEYVHPSLAAPSGSPHDFYTGVDFGWYATIEGLDVRRTLTDRILNDLVVRAEDERPSLAELYVIKGEAGAGKTVFLRRLAWEAANSADVLCLYLREEGTLRIEALREVHRTTKQRMFLFVDGAARHAVEISHLLAGALRERLPVTVFTTERHNSWNVACDRLKPQVTDFLQLNYLSRTELGQLVDLLAKHDSLGPNLTNRTRDECVQQFEERAGRQLLVALHEATVGAPFEDIVAHEYEQVEPARARSLYLTVCVLNRLRVSVRAGLIARIHGIPFDAFESELFAPLEHVVFAKQHPGTQDFLYSARHPEIAQIVFERALTDAKERLNEYLRIVSHLNLAYSTDRYAFRALIRAKVVDELFPSFDEALAVFEAAERTGPTEAYVPQQRANYERIRANGSPARAEELLQRARTLDPDDSSIIHTLSEIKRAKAQHANHALERAKYRNEARALLQPLLRDRNDARYARVTLVKLSLDELRDTLADPTTTERDVDSAIRTVETHLERGQQQYPDEQFLLTAESTFASILRQDDRALSALRRAFETNSRDAYIASRLARLLEDSRDLAAAEDVLSKALNGNRGDKQLNFQYAEILRRRGDAPAEILIYHYRRAFTKWDDNHEAQFWFARFAFESSLEADRADSKETFRRLREVALAHDARVRERDTVGGQSGPATFFGTIIRMEYTHGFIEREGEGDWIFVHRRQTEVWESLSLGDRVSFNLAFTFSGAIAINAKVE